MRASHAASGFAIALGALLVVPHAFAHHSFAPHFDSSKPVSISGTITEFEARNPHSYLHIAAVDENGTTREYVCESHGVTQLTRNGITPRDAQGRHEGSRHRIAVAAQPLHVLLRQRRVRGRPHAERQRSEGCRSTAAAATIAARKDIFGTWLLAPIPNRSTSGPQPMMQFLTPAGEKAVAAYDPFKDDPTFRCDPVAIRRVWGAPGTPLEIVRDGNDVVLHHEWMDVRRVIHMNMKEHPKNGPRSSLGHSIGRMEGDTLVIETGELFGGRAESVRRAAGPADQGLAALGRAHVGRAARTSTPRVSVSSWRSISTDPEFFKQPFPRSRNGVRAIGAEDRAVQLLARGRDGHDQEIDTGSGIGHRDSGNLSASVLGVSCQTPAYPMHRPHASRTTGSNEHRRSSGQRQAREDRPCSPTSCGNSRQTRSRSPLACCPASRDRDVSGSGTPRCGRHEIFPRATRHASLY